MRRIIDTSEVLGLLDTREGEQEICVAANADYDETTATLFVKLEAFLRNPDVRGKETRSRAEWLPKPETVRESVGPEEALDVARDIFHRWARKVRQAAPSLHAATF